MTPPAATTMPTPPAYFDAMFADDDDPWRFKTRWYEARKRALTLASLPAPHYASAFEPGCANGELSASLAARCGRLRVMDGAQRAVALARTRLAALPHVTVAQGWMPQDWPPGEPFDLVVISELGYFLSPAALDELALRTRASLQPGGTVLACHWRRAIEGCEMRGDEVHERLHLALDMQRLAEWVDEDLRLAVWCLDTRSVGGREGLR